VVDPAQKTEPGSSERYIQAQVDVPNPDGQLSLDAAGSATLKLGSEALVKRLLGH
jgi:hypothetical protein